MPKGKKKELKLKELKNKEVLEDKENQLDDFIYKVEELIKEDKIKINFHYQQIEIISEKMLENVKRLLLDSGAEPNYVNKVIKEKQEKYKNKKVIDKIQDLYNIEKMKDKIKK